MFMPPPPYKMSLYIFKKFKVFVLSVIPSHQMFSSQLLTYNYMELNETWQRCCTTSPDVHEGRYSTFSKFCHLGMTLGT